MKILLILIAVFMSPLTFAQLEGKGLICIPTFDPPNLLTLEAFLFESDAYEIFYEYELRVIKDQVKVAFSDQSGTYYSTSGYIHWNTEISIFDNNIKARYQLNRRTLNLEKGPVNFQCEIFEDKENFEIGISGMKEKAQAQYDEALKDNKI
jgi:hypothetical protein